jgi:hypothetical protein
MAYLGTHDAGLSRLDPVRFYRRLPESVRRCTRPLNLVDECASFLPASLRAGATTATEMARRLLRLARVRYSLYRLERAEAPASLIVADDLSRRYWTHALSLDAPVDAPSAFVRALDVPRAARRTARDVDLELWQLPWPLSRGAIDAAIVPSAIPLWLDTARPLEAIVTGAPRGRSSRRDDARRVRRLGLTARLATTATECERFRRDLYEPYTSRRFGGLFSSIPAHTFRHAWRSGWLLLLEDAGHTVAGALLERWRRDVRILAFGVAIDGPLPTGLLLEACYYHSIRFATETQLPRLSLGTTRPVLSDGVLRYKRKWGASVGPPSTWEVFGLRYRNTPAVRALFARAPIVVDRGSAGLATIVGAAGRSPGDAFTSVETPGIAEVACLADEVSSLADGVPRRHTIRPGEVWPTEARLPG